MTRSESNAPASPGAGPLGWSPAGWRLLALWTLVLSIVTGWALAAHGTSDEALGLVARNAARAAFVAFVLAFGARALRELVAPALGAWLMGKRSQLGVAFALSHFLFLATNVTRVRLHYGGDPFALRPPSSWYGGGLLFVVIAALALTSFPGPARRLGPRWWKRLHLFGGWALLATFLASYGMRARTMPFYVPFAILGFALVGLRVGAALKRDDFGVRTRLSACLARCLG